MNINANTGLITWIPNSTGNYCWFVCFG
jgi:hypothetical protein